MSARRLRGSLSRISSASSRSFSSWHHQPVALQIRGERGVRAKRDAGGEEVPQLGLAAALDHGGPVEDLQTDLEADLLHLLPGHQGRVVHVLVLLGGDPADRLAGVARLLQQR